MQPMRANERSDPRLPMTRNARYCCCSSDPDSRILKSIIGQEVLMNLVVGFRGYFVVGNAMLCPTVMINDCIVFFTSSTFMFIILHIRLLLRIYRWGRLVREWKTTSLQISKLHSRCVMVGILASLHLSFGIGIRVCVEQCSGGAGKGRDCEI